MTPASSTTCHGICHPSRRGFAHATGAEPVHPRGCLLQSLAQVDATGGLHALHEFAEHRRDARLGVSTDPLPTDRHMWSFHL